jgi:hypothetical protein
VATYCTTDLKIINADKINNKKVISTFDIPSINKINIRKSVPLALSSKKDV